MYIIKILKLKVKIMQMLIILGFVIFATMAVFGTINMIRQINKIKNED
jgi:hypothetical protein